MDHTRYSSKRDAILQCLRSTTCHPSAEWVYAQLKPRIPNLSLATVYRNLARFRAEGAVQVIGCVDGEDRYDGNTAPHGHFVCRACGAVMKCPECDLSLVYHKKEHAMICHYCGRQFPLPETCPVCGSRYLKHYGIGTEQVEEAVAALFPKAALDRLDLDAV